MLLFPQCLENAIANCHGEREWEEEKQDTTPVTDTQAYFIALLIYMQAHTQLKEREFYK